MSTFLLVLTHKITTAFITNKARNIWNEICDFPFWTSFEEQACALGSKCKTKNLCCPLPLKKGDS
jgi:hypothetical protein